MKKLITLITVLGAISTTIRPIWLKHLEDYTRETAELVLGAQRIDPEQKAQIRQIAQKMDVAMPFSIRQMNHQAASIYGYYNSFIYWPSFIFLPIGKPFLFLSPGFFDEFSLEEQRFLIGHELTHIKESHTRYLELLNLITFLIFLLALHFLGLFRSRTNGSSVIMNILLISLFLTFFTSRNLINLAYRRHVEWIADDRCLRVLREFDGCHEFMDRYQTTYALPDTHPYYGLFEDHPSCAERKRYCLKLSQELKDAE